MCLKDVPRVIKTQVFHHVMVFGVIRFSNQNSGASRAGLSVLSQLKTTMLSRMFFTSYHYSVFYLKQISSKLTVLCPFVKK